MPHAHRRFVCVLAPAGLLGSLTVAFALLAISLLRMTTDFEPGDVLCFGMHTLHGALDNASSTGRCRLSSDSRYQRIDEPADPRWNGERIEGHGGSRVFYPGLGNWNNRDFQDEWKDVDDRGRLILHDESIAPTGQATDE